MPRPRRAQLPPGTVVVKYRELLTPVGAEGTTAYPFLPGSSGLSHLDLRAGMYEMYRLRGPVKYAYKAAVGTTTNGEVIMGTDFDGREVVLSYQGTAALSPKSMGPVWRDQTLVVPPARAMKQKWLLTSNLRDDAHADPAFTVQVSGTAVSQTGSIWVEYHIEFASPRAPTKPLATSALEGTAGAAATKEISANGVSALKHTGAKTYFATQDVTSIATLPPGYSAQRVGDYVGIYDGVMRTIYEIITSVTVPGTWADISDFILKSTLATVTIGPSITSLVQQLYLKPKL